MKSNLFPLKREETQVKNRINKDSDYFPQEHAMKSQHTSTFNKVKRPLSSMAKKNQGPSNSRQ